MPLIMPMTFLTKAAALAAFLLSPLAPMHELQDNRATLVLRDKTHLSVTLYLNFTDALHRALGGTRTRNEFVLAYSAMPARDLHRELARAEQRFAAQTKIAAANGAAVTLESWKWPTVSEVQRLLQQQAMQLVVAPNEHAYEQPLEIHAEAIAQQAITTVTVKFPVEFQRVLVVSYTPKQVWVEANGVAPPIRF